MAKAPFVVFLTPYHIPGIFHSFHFFVTRRNNQACTPRSAVWALPRPQMWFEGANGGT